MNDNLNLKKTLVFHLNKIGSLIIYILLPEQLKDNPKQMKFLHKCENNQLVIKIKDSNGQTLIDYFYNFNDNSFSVINIKTTLPKIISLSSPQNAGSNNNSIKYLVINYSITKSAINDYYFADKICLLTNIKYFIIPFILIAYYYLFYYILITNELNKRITKLDNEALTFFEILTLTLESGKNLENALEITCYNIDSELSNEFKKSLIETKFGKSLMEALDDLKKKIPSENINNIILNITQTNIFGNNIVDVMNNQVEYLRDKQLMEIKSQINKIPNKVSIISVLFIVPLILLIVLGPFIINLLG